MNKRGRGFLKAWMVILGFLLLLVWFVAPEQFSTWSSPIKEYVNEVTNVLQGENESFTVVHFRCVSAEHCQEALPDCEGACLCADTGECVIPEVVGS